MISDGQRSDDGRKQLATIFFVPFSHGIFLGPLFKSKIKMYFERKHLVPGPLLESQIQFDLMIVQQTEIPP